MATIQKSNNPPFKIWQAIGGLVGGIYGGIQAGKANKKAAKAEEAAKLERDRMKEIYSAVDTSNPFEGSISPNISSARTISCTEIRCNDRYARSSKSSIDG